MNHLSIFCLLFFLGVAGRAQTPDCVLEMSSFNDIYKVDKNDLICLSQNTKKDKTLVFSFAIWCAPCIKHLPNAIKLAEDYNLDFYVLLIEKEDDRNATNALSFLNQIKKEANKDFQVVILKDSYGKRSNKKYKAFLDEITPDTFENINGMSKYIVIDQEGTVLMVTNWKDNRENDWQDDSKMIEKRIIPILK